MRLIQGDCLTVMKQLADQGVRVDLILTDPPYGNINSLGNGTDKFTKHDTSWDNILPTKEMYLLCRHLIRANGTLILFSQEPYTSKLRTNTVNGLKFSYPLIWKKDHFANHLGSKKAPVSYFEDLNVFRKKIYSPYAGSLRNYSKKILDFIGLSSNEIRKKLGHRKLEHFFCITSSQFELPSREGYNELINFFKINECDEFRRYADLKIEWKRILEEHRKHNPVVFNLSDNKKVKGNILEYRKDNHNKLHPTQKPVKLLEDLIKTYTNPGDLVLDFTMGSGSTGVACQNTNRNFIGIELDKEYFKIAEKRIKEAQGQPQLTSFNKPLKECKT